MQNTEPIKNAILEILMLSKFTKRKDLLPQLTAKGFYVSDRVLRLSVESMIVEDHYSIASSNDGYSLIVTLSDLEGAVSYLEKKAKAISIRKNSLLRNFSEGKLIQQLSLFSNQIES